MTYVVLKDYDGEFLQVKKYIFSPEEINNISDIWNKMDNILVEITKIDFCKKIKKWKDVDQDLLRLILLTSLINKKDENFIKLILKVLMYSIQVNLVNCNINYITIIKINDELDINLNLDLSTKVDSIKRLDKKDCKSNLTLVVDNTKE